MHFLAGFQEASVLIRNRLTIATNSPSPQNLNILMEYKYLFPTQVTGQCGEGSR